MQFLRNSLAIQEGDIQYLSDNFFSFQLLTEKYGDLAISLKANAGKDIEDNVIESVQAIEDFAFKYAVLNLNASKNQERKKNQHIGEKNVLTMANLTSDFIQSKDA